MLSSFNILLNFKVISITVMPPTDFSVFKNFRTKILENRMQNWL